jgi:hypothetical protein
MSPSKAFSAGKGTGKRQNRSFPTTTGKFGTQATTSAIPAYPFQPLPPPNGPAPYRFDLSQLLAASDVKAIEDSGTMVFHSVGDTGDYRGRQQDFVADMMTADAKLLPAAQKPAFFYHLGDVVYFAGDIDLYGANFYETYKEYPAFIVAIPGNHDCQPDDPMDGPVDPNKKPLDGFVQNFMSKNPGQLGSLKTGAGRTQMDLPNVYWTFTTPVATIIGLFSNVGETEGEIHPDQVAWFQGELKAANPKLALIVTVHHPSFSGDTEHMGSSAVYNVLSESFTAANRFPDLVLSGHVHNYQRFTNTVTVGKGKRQIPYVVAGFGGYTRLTSIHTINGKLPQVPLTLGDTLTLEQYDVTNFGFLRIAVNKQQILVNCYSAMYEVGGTPDTKLVESFSVNLKTHAVKTLS